MAALTSKGVGAEYIELNKDPSAPVIAQPEVPIAGFTWAECSYLCCSAFQWVNWILSRLHHTRQCPICVGIPCSFGDRVHHCPRQPNISQDKPATLSPYTRLISGLLSYPNRCWSPAAASLSLLSLPWIGPRILEENSGNLYLIIIGSLKCVLLLATRNAQNLVAGQPCWWILFTFIMALIFQILLDPLTS